MIKLPSIAEAQKALKGGKDPRAFLHLGILYAQGLGTEQDDLLATYFIKKAHDMGSKEAEEYVNYTYEAGMKDFATEIASLIGDESSLTLEKIAKIRARVEVERKAKNYGNLSKIRKYLTLIYPEYNRDQAIDDIMNDRDTIGADILYSTCTSDNTSEVYVEHQERLLRQLYAPVDMEDDVWEYIDLEVVGKDENELAQCIVNLTSSYDKISQRYNICKKEIYTLETMDLCPYFKIPELALLRRQGFRCLLSLIVIEPLIYDEFLNNLADDKLLLDICEKIKDQDIQLFLISFIELNIDLDSLEISSLQLLKAYRSNNLTPLVEHINAFVNRLSKANIRHHLPIYTTENLPPIDLSDFDF